MHRKARLSQSRIWILSKWGLLHLRLRICNSPFLGVWLSLCCDGCDLLSCQMERTGDVHGVALRSAGLADNGQEAVVGGFVEARIRI